LIAVYYRPSFHTHPYLDTLHVHSVLFLAFLLRSLRTDKRIMLVAQKQADVDDPKADDLYRIATVATVLQLLKLPDGTVKVLVEGVDRARIEKLHAGDYYSADATLLPDAEAYDEKEMDVLARSVISQFEQYVKLNKKVPPEVLTALAGI
jgi:ATP-dependent Lon protease